MVPEIRIEALTPWIEVLCEAGDSRARDRLLLESVLALDLAAAAAIWRRGRDGMWREHVARGPADLLPRAGDVEALANRTIPPDVLPARRVHVSGDVALALGGVSEERERHGVADALLATYAGIAAASPAESWPAPLPSSAPPTNAEPSTNAVQPMNAAQSTSSAPRSSSASSSSSAARDADLPGSEEARRVQHDLRNVMTSLKATEDLLARFADGLSPEESLRFRATVERECARAGELLAQGLMAQGLITDEKGLIAEDPDESHYMEHWAGSGAWRGPPLRPAPLARSCVAADFVDQVLDAELAQLGRAGIEVRRLIDPAVRRTRCTIPAQQFARIVQNLVVNARQAILRRTDGPRAGSLHGCIWITLERAEYRRRPALALVVEDDGPGIEARDLERVFEAGFTSGASSGRGLAIVRSLAQDAGGSARAEIRVLGGARLRITLPIVDRENSGP